MKITHCHSLSLTLILVLSGLMTLSAQQDTFTGQLTDSMTRQPIPFAHIENYSGHNFTISDKTGQFTLRISPGDTLIFSAIGYLYKTVAVTDSLLEYKNTPVFEMHQRVYELAEAQIHLPGSYENFKQDFLSLEFEETEADELKQNLQKSSVNMAVKAYKESIANARTELAQGGVRMVGVGIPSATEINKKRMKKYLSHQKKLDLIYEKYNAHIVKEITGLTDENEVVSFMLFCDFEEEYLLEVNPVDLMKQIEEKYKVFHKDKTG